MKNRFVEKIQPTANGNTRILFELNIKVVIVIVTLKKDKYLTSTGGIDGKFYDRLTFITIMKI